MASSSWGTEWEAWPQLGDTEWEACPQWQDPQQGWGDAEWEAWPQQRRQWQPGWWWQGERWLFWGIGGTPGEGAWAAIPLPPEQCLKVTVSATVDLRYHVGRAHLYVSNCYA